MGSLSKRNCFVKQVAKLILKREQKESSKKLYQHISIYSTNSQANLHTDQDWKGKKKRCIRKNRSDMTAKEKEEVK